MPTKFSPMHRSMYEWSRENEAKTKEILIRTFCHINIFDLLFMFLQVFSVFRFYTVKFLFI